MELILIGAAIVGTLLSSLGRDGLQALFAFIIGAFVQGRVMSHSRAECDPSLHKRRTLPAYLLEQTAAHGLVCGAAFVVCATTHRDWYLFGAMLAGSAYGRTYYDKSDTTGVRAWPALRRARLWQWLRHLFQHRVLRVSFGGAEAPAPARAALYACHPHGIFGLFVVLSFMATTQDSDSDSEETLVVTLDDDVEAPAKTRLARLPTMKPRPPPTPEPPTNHPPKRTIEDAPRPRPVAIGIHSLLLAIPLVRELALWMGAVDVHWDALRYQMEREHRDVAVIPEGVLGMGKRLPSARERLGFLKRAFDAGDVDVVPVLCPNETDLCHVWAGEWEWVTNIREWSLQCKYLRYPFPTWFVGPVSRGPLVTLVGPRHTTRLGEDFITYRARYAIAVANLWRAWYAYQQQLRATRQGDWTT